MANGTSSVSWPSTRGTTTNTGAPVAGPTTSAAQAGHPVDVTGRIKRTHVVHGLISEYQSSLTAQRTPVQASVWLFWYCTWPGRLIKRKLKKIQYRPHLIDGYLAATGLKIEPW